MTTNRIAIANPALDHTHDLPVCNSDVAAFKSIVGDGAGAVSAVPSTVGGAGGLRTIGAGAGA